MKAGRIAALTLVHVGKKSLVVRSFSLVVRWFSCLRRVWMILGGFFSHRLLPHSSNLASSLSNLASPASSAAFAPPSLHSPPPCLRLRLLRGAPRFQASTLPPQLSSTPHFRFPLLGFVVLGFRACDRLPNKSKIECDPRPRRRRHYLSQARPQ
jgi:hypothetical protein